MNFNKHLMNDLEKYFRNNNGKLISKWIHYFNIYDKHFARFRNEEVVILEIGVYQGGSLQMWKNYFGPKAKIYGIDIDSRCKQLEEENIKIFIGSQDDRKFLNEVKKEIPPIDILIDDGGYFVHQQIISFEELFSHIKHNGVYLCEDIHTSYRIKFGGGYKRRGSFIEYTKNFIDYMNAFHSQQRCLKVNSFTTSVESIHYYDSVIVLEKSIIEKPHEEKIGNMVFHELPLKGINKLIFKSTYAIIKVLNLILAFFRLPSVAMGKFKWS